jgi:hypothetical protein
VKTFCRPCTARDGLEKRSIVLGPLFGEIFLKRPQDELVHTDPIFGGIGYGISLPA